MRTIDRIFGWLMVADGLYLTALVFFLTISHIEGLAWNAGHCVAILLLSACNVMRAERPHDRTLARVCAAGNLIWLILMIAYARTIAAPLTQALQAFIATVLLMFSVKTLRHSRPM